MRLTVLERDLDRDLERVRLTERDRVRLTDFERDLDRDLDRPLVRGRRALDRDLERERERERDLDLDLWVFRPLRNVTPPRPSSSPSGAKSATMDRLPYLPPRLVILEGRMLSLHCISYLGTR